MSQNDLIFSMGAAYRGAMELFRGAVARKDKQSSLSLSILVQLDKKSGLSQGELGKILRRDPMTMSQAVRTLEDTGMLVSQQDTEDRRIKRLSITKKGKSIGLSVSEAENKLLSGLSKEWGKSRMNQFSKDLSEFNDYINRTRGYLGN